MVNHKDEFDKAYIIFHFLINLIYILYDNKYIIVYYLFIFFKYIMKYN